MIPDKVHVCIPKPTTNPWMLQTQLPADYIDLEKKVDALKQAHQRMLTVTSVFRPGWIYLGYANACNLTVLNTPLKPMTTLPTSKRRSKTWVEL